MESISSFTPIRGREAEEVTPHKRVRQLSAPPMCRAAIQETELEAIAHRTGSLWKCISRHPDKLGNYIYRFRLGDEFDDVTPSDNQKERMIAGRARSREASPATEPSGSDVISPDGFPGRYFAPLQRFGYKWEVTKEGVFVELPDRETILAHWDSDVKKFDILEIDEFAGELPFIDAYFTHDAFLSKRREFVHDQLNHMMPTLLLHLNSHDPNKTEGMARGAKAVARWYRRLMISKRAIETNLLEIEPLKRNIRHMEYFVSSFVDDLRMAAHSSYFSKSYCDWFMKGAVQGAEPAAKESLLKKGIETDASYTKLWEMMRVVELEFDNL